MEMMYTKVVERNMQEIPTFIRQISTPKGIDDAIEMIVQVLTTASKIIPTSCYRPNLKPFWNTELDNLKKFKVSKFKNLE